MIDAGAVVLDVIPDTRNFGRKLQGDLSRGSSGGRLSSVGKGIGTKIMAGLGAVVAGEQIVRFFAGAVDAASDLSESQSKVQQVFRGSAGEVERFASTSATSLGQSKQAALEAAGTFGNLFTSLGLSREASADMSIETVKLGSDLASFNNIAPEEALEKLRAGLVGEIEPLRQLGVSFNAADVEARAMKLGLADANGEISESAKVQARMSLIMEQTTNAQGDFTRTSGGLANQQRILSAQWTDMKARIGQALLPVITRLAVFANTTLLPALADAGDGARRLGERFSTVVDAVRKVIAPLTSAGTAVGKDGPLGRGMAELQRYVGIVWPRIQEIVRKAVAIVVQVARGAMDLIRGVWARGGSQIMANVRSVWRNISSVVSGSLDVILGLMDVLLSALRGDWAGAWEGVKRIVSGAWRAIQGLFRAGGAALRAITRTALAVIQTLFSGAWTRIRNSLSSFWSAVWRLWDQATQRVRTVTSNALTAIRNAFTSAGSRIRAIVSDLWSRVRSVWTTATQAVRTATSNALEAIRNLWTNASSRVRTVVSDLWSRVRSLFSSALDRVKSIVQGAIVNLVLRFVGLKNSIIKGLSNLPTLLLNLGKKIFEKFADGIRSAVGKVKDAIGAIVGVFDGLGAAGDGLGVLGTAGLAGTRGGSLLGISPLSAVGRAYSLLGRPGSVISGLRPGARTLSGNLSYHAQGRALDLSPIRAIAQAIRARFGGRTLELITPWRELDLHHGRPHTYSAAVHAQHSGGNAHIHWAMADGGLVNRQGRFLVGEEGPEVLNLGRGDMVTPLDEVAGAGGLAAGDRVTLEVEGYPLTAIVRANILEGASLSRTVARKGRRRR